jgi:N-acetylmuramoyl-L-alanine amidase
LWLTPVVFSQTTTANLTLVTRDGRRALPLFTVSDQEFIALDDLASAFQLSVQESLGAITVSYKGKTIVLTPDQSLASVAGRLISLPAAPSRNGRRWLVPTEFLSRALAPIYDTRLELRKPSHLLIVGDLRVPRLALRYDSLGTTGRLTIDATPQANSTVSQTNEAILVKFDADALDASTPLLSGSLAGAPIQGAHVVDPLTVSVDLSPRFNGFKASSQPVDSTRRLVLEFAAPPTETTAQPAAPATPPPAEPPAPGAAVPAIRTITIDPGHGGEDEGVHGAAGVKEKDIALSVARRLKGALEARLGVRVLLTRDDDRNVGIDERTALANNNKADLFISVHANASFRSTTAGATVYHAGFSKEALDAAGRRSPDRLPAFGGGLRDVEMVPWDLAQSRHLTQSTTFADLLLAQLKDHVPMAAKPSDEAVLRVLESANMPAVLIELGYLSNPAQEKAMAAEPFQSGVVAAVYQAIVQYRDSLQNGGGH